MRVFAVLAARGVRILYAHTRYRFELLDHDFFAALEQRRMYRGRHIGRQT